MEKQTIAEKQLRERNAYLEGRIKDLKEIQGLLEWICFDYKKQVQYMKENHPNIFKIPCNSWQEKSKSMPVLSYSEIAMFN